MIKWSLQKGYVALPKSINKERITANVAVSEIKIKGEDMKLIDKLDEHLVTGMLSIISYLFTFAMLIRNDPMHRLGSYRLSLDNILVHGWVPQCPWLL